MYLHSNTTKIGTAFFLADGGLAEDTAEEFDTLL